MSIVVALIIAWPAIASPCLKAPDHAAVSQCLDQTLQAAEGELSRRLKAVRARMDAQRKYFAGRSYFTIDESETYFEALDAAQALWREFRDRECKFETFPNHGGSGEGDFYLLCQIELTLQRSKRLEAMVRQ